MMLFVLDYCCYVQDCLTKLCLATNFEKESITSFCISILEFWRKFSITKSLSQVLPSVSAQISGGGITARVPCDTAPLLDSLCLIKSSLKDQRSTPALLIRD